MPTGLDHVQTTIALCQRLSAVAADMEETARVAVRLTQVKDKLENMQSRFFLRSKLCLPFAARCEQEARKLEQALEGSDAGTHSARHVQALLTTLEQAVKVLDDRSAAQDMVIT